MAEENGQVEEAEMMEDSEIEKKIEEGAKTANKELGLPDIDDEEGREDSEEDGEGGTSKSPENKQNPLKHLQKQKQKKKMNLEKKNLRKEKKIGRTKV